jgi:Leucine-rich repeat (LRR) protein
MKSLIWLGLRFTNVVDFSPLGKLPNLRVTQLDGMNVKNISTLDNLTNLQQVSLRSTEVSDVGN